MMEGRREKTEGKTQDSQIQAGLENCESRRLDEESGQLKM